jgi:hypothetical protein
VWVTVVATGLGGKGRRTPVPSFTGATSRPVREEDPLEPPSFLRR